MFFQKNIHPIEGIASKYYNNLEVYLQGNEDNIKKVAQMLTIQNLAVTKQIQQLKTVSPRSPKHAASIVEKLRELEAQQYYEPFEYVNSTTLSVPSGYWFIGQPTTDYHLSDIKPVFLDDERYYQKDIVENLLKYKRSCAVAATGTGKSMIIRDLCVSYALANKKVLVFVPSIELLEQTAARIDQGLQAVGLPKCGRLGNGKKPDTQRVVISTIQSAYQICDNFHALIADECFLGNEKVKTDRGVFTFEELFAMKSLPKALSYNEETKQFEYKEIEAVSKKPRKNDIVKVFTNRGKFRSTDNHKFLTTSGWKRADNLKTGDKIISYEEGESKCRKFLLSPTHIQILIGSFLGGGYISQTKTLKRLVFTHGIKQKDYCIAKLSFFNSNYYFIKNNGYSQKPAIRGATKSMEMPLYITSKAKKYINENLINHINWLGFAIWIMDDGTFCFNRNKTLVGLKIHSNAFDVQSLTLFLNQLNKKFNLNGKIRFNKKFPIICFNSYDANNIKKYIETNVNLLEGMYKFDSKLPLLSPNPLVYYSVVKKIKTLNTKNITSIDTSCVYDIQVKDNHNFLLSNSHSQSITDMSFVVAHNCHILSAPSYIQVAMNAASSEYMHGLTATIDRPDNLSGLIYGWSGPVVYKYSYKQAVEDKFLSPIKYYQKTVTTKVHTHQNMNAIKEYIAHHSDDSYLMEVKKVVEQSLEKGRKTLVLFKSNECCEKLAKMLGVEAANGEYRTPLYDFKKDSQLLIANTVLVGTGIDVPGISSIIYCAAGTSEIIFMQSMGRGTRLFPGKEDCIVVDMIPATSKYIGQGYIRKRMVDTNIND